MKKFLLLCVVLSTAFLLAWIDPVDAGRKKKGGCGAAGLSSQGGCGAARMGRAKVRMRAVVVEGTQSTTPQKSVQSSGVGCGCGNAACTCTANAAMKGVKVE